MNLAKLTKAGAGLVALSAIVFATPSQAAQPAISFTTADTQVNSGFTIGYKFTVGAAGITVSSLGVYDDGADGLVSSHNVGIWDSTGTTLLGSGTVGSGVSGTLNGKFRYVSISNLALSANTSYLIGSTAGNDLWAYQNYTGLTVDSAITVNENRFNTGGSLAAPGSTTGTPGQTLFAGPNFLFAPTGGGGGGGGGGVPEPGTVALLLASGFSSLGVVARNRRIRK